MSVDTMQLAAEKYHGVPAGWKWCKMDCGDTPEDFIEVHGAVPSGVYRSGKKKGLPRWPKELQRIWIRRSEMQSAAIEWEEETGKCHQCEGGQECWGWSAKDGRILRACKRCNGTGLKPSMENTK